MKMAIAAIIFLGGGSLVLAGLGWLQKKFNINQYLAAAVGIVVLGLGIYFGAKAWL